MTLGIRALDTAYNYLTFTSHRTLARTAGDLLSEFSISTKVGFFPGREHSLDPRRLRMAVEKSAEDLHQSPAVVFLHNPERSLTDHSPGAARERLAAACTALHEATSEGLCSSWGIATWNPRVMLAALSGPDVIPTPTVVMVRAGLLVSTEVLGASEALSARFGLDVDARWGMSPFGGRTTDPVWDMVNARVFLHGGQTCSNLQAAFRVAYELPRVGRIAVGTNSVGHLRDLLAAVTQRADERAIIRYRELLHSRALGAPAT